MPQHTNVKGLSPVAGNKRFKIGTDQITTSIIKLDKKPLLFCDSGTDPYATTMSVLMTAAAQTTAGPFTGIQTESVAVLGTKIIVHLFLFLIYEYFVALHFNYG